MSEKNDDPAVAAWAAMAGEEDPPLRRRDFALEDYALIAVFWALAGIVFAQVFTRYVLNNSYAWTEEVSRYLQVTLTFLGLSFAVRRGSHVMVEFFYRYLRRRAARVLSTVVDLLTIVFAAYVTVMMLQVADLAQGQTMADLPISRGVLYVVVAVGFAFYTVRLVQSAIAHRRSGESPLIRWARNDGAE